MYGFFNCTFFFKTFKYADGVIEFFLSCQVWVVQYLVPVLVVHLVLKFFWVESFKSFIVDDCGQKVVPLKRVRGTDGKDRTGDM